MFPFTQICRLGQISFNNKCKIYCRLKSTKIYDTIFDILFKYLILCSIFDPLTNRFLLDHQSHWLITGVIVCLLLLFIQNSWLHYVFYLLTFRPFHCWFQSDLVENMILYLSIASPLLMLAILMTIEISCAIVEQVFGMNNDEFKHDYEQFCQNNDLLVFGFTFETEYLRRQDNYKHCQVCTLPIENIEYSILTRRDNYCVLTHCGHFFHACCPTDRQHTNKCPCCQTIYKIGYDVSPVQLLKNKNHLEDLVRQKDIIRREIFQHHEEELVQQNAVENNQSTITYSILKKNKHQQHNRYDTSECCICLKTLDNRINVLTSCQHILHNTCFQRWIKIYQSCPICQNRS